MVFYFTSSHGGVDWTIFMGRDKFENEDLIKYGIDRDIWFHVDDLSSAHVYIRMPMGYTMNTIPEVVVKDCSHLVKANSIEGCKKSSVKIVYTPWSNLKKTSDMASGQIGFRDTSQLRFTHVDKANEIVNRLNRTKKEHPSTIIKQSKEDYERQLRNIDKKKKRQDKESADQEKADKAQLNFDMGFGDLFSESNKKQMNSDMRVTSEEFEQDFM